MKWLPDCFASGADWLKKACHCAIMRNIVFDVFFVRPASTWESNAAGGEGIMQNDRTYLFEQAPVSRAVFAMSMPTIASSLVMVLYNLADTYFVGMLNDPVQNAAVTLAAPVLLAFNAINNLFGVGSSSMMSRALGRGDRETARQSSSFGFWCSLLCGGLISLFFLFFSAPALRVLGAGAENAAATADYLF